MHIRGMLPRWYLVCQITTWMDTISVSSSPISLDVEKTRGGVVFVSDHL